MTKKAGTVAHLFVASPGGPPDINHLIRRELLMAESASSWLLRLASLYRLMLFGEEDGFDGHGILACKILRNQGEGRYP
jgi:hypothetical protein